MRPLTHGDLVAAACAVLSLRPEDRESGIARMIAQAEAADRFRRRNGRAHPAWGNGSLMAAALMRPRAREPFLDDREYCACLALVIDVLLRRAGGKTSP